MTLQQQMKKKLESLGLPFIEIECYGREITVECKSRDTCEKWAFILGKFSKIRGLIEDYREKADTPEFCNMPEHYKVYRVYARIC